MASAADELVIGAPSRRVGVSDAELGIGAPSRRVSDTADNAADDRTSCKGWRAGVEGDAVCTGGKVVTCPPAGILWSGEPEGIWILPPTVIQS